ncbi:2-oxoacid:acceptor oxidoreductase subunit alpha [Pseudoalteromonas rubra]|uniref:2-oxoglutarate ferredoxin oxidoreductase subunit alpha n=1 Tax=Pseudoalteromonas rubra TaxID=43658 RepID=A0A0F4R2L6_9GAMM|nr:2-oxoacid:acceptor oxidoreductase subunit alpha [Pseudoalteromonas rubra]KJZ13032.1 2-oxoglutarate ferredoxin oxidoreductase subunit alpha [Pseudoalteromonas rubra]
MIEVSKAEATNREVLEEVTILFSGDSGDGIQLIGDRFAYSSSVKGNDISCFPDFPAEIRAPAGTTAGVSGFKLCFSSEPILTPGDHLDAMVAMNPAALKQNISELSDNGILIINSDSFKEKDCVKAGYQENPLKTGELDRFRLVEIPLTQLTLDALSSLNLPRKKALLCKNMLSLGVVCWLYERPIEELENWLDAKFGKQHLLSEANKKALHSGYNYADTIELFDAGFRVPKANLPKGRYRHITGNEALALGAVVASIKCKRELFFASYPITPSSDVLHSLARYKNFGVKTFQSEDEISAMGAVVGASFAGNLALTSTSGPGLDLKQEMLGLAVMAELPAVVFNIQRAGPSTGMPTKTEQTDLLAALYGRHGECEVPVLAPSTPADCFTMAIEAFRIAVTYMTPVIVLSDGYLANSAEPWQIPTDEDIDGFSVANLPAQSDGALFQRCPNTLARSWVLPGQKGLEHRLGGLERDYDKGAISYDPDNHFKMVLTRKEKIKRISQDISPISADEYSGADVLVVAWGSTHGALHTAVQQLKSEGYAIDHLHLRNLNPLPEGLGDCLRRYRKVLVAELNLGQLNSVLKNHWSIETEVLQKVSGMPFKIDEVYQHCKQLLTDNSQ